jgi:hypothetical protein
LSQEKQLDAYAMPGWRWGGGMGTMTTSTTNIGTLVLDMYDVSFRQMVWGVCAIDPQPQQEP